MKNKAMERKLQTRECLAVEDEGGRPPAFSREKAAPVERMPTDETDHRVLGTWQIGRFVEDVDYCVRSKEQWIWSIGKSRATGCIYAATDNRFYQHPGFECLYLR